MTEENKENEVVQKAPAQETPGAQPEAEKKPEKEAERTDMTTLHERTIATLSYFGPLAVIPFYLKKDSEFCRFHGKQGMFLAIFFFMAQLLTVLDFIFDLMLLLQVFLMFWMGFAALSGRWKKIPFGYKYACQVEEVLTLKTKAQEEGEVGLQPNAVPEEEKPNETK